jgi:hypothetical protein
VGHAGFNLLPRHVQSQHRQRMAQVDHLIEPQTEKIFGGCAAWHVKNSQKSGDKLQEYGSYCTVK